MLAFTKHVDIVAAADVGIGESVKTGLQQCDNSFSQLVDFKIANGAFGNFR